MGVLARELVALFAAREGLLAGLDVLPGGSVLGVGFRRMLVVVERGIVRRGVVLEGDGPGPGFGGRARLGSSRRVRRGRVA